MFRKLWLVSLALALLTLVGCQAPAATPVIQTVVVTATPEPITPTVAPTQTPVVVVVTATPVPVTPTAVPGSTLRIVGLNGEKTLTIDELKALPVTEGYGGTKSSTGKITPPALFKGVSLLELCNQVGGCDESTALSIVAKDGYAMTISHDQVVNGDFVTFHPETGEEIAPSGPLTAVLAYEREGQPFDVEEDGQLRLLVLSAAPDQVTDGHWSVKWAREVIVKPAITEWTLHLEGALVEEMSRDTFESGASPSCHESPWVDAEGHEWVGIPLYYLVGRVDDGNKHEGGAFNDELVTKGYQIDVVAADGYKVTFDAARVSRNKNIIVAFQMDGQALGEEDWPLRLVGSDLDGAEMVGAVAQIVVYGENIVPATESPTPAPTKAADTAEEDEASAAAAPEMAAGVLHIYGKVSTPTAFDRAALEQLGVETFDVEHPKKGTISVEGVSLNEALTACEPEAGATCLIFTAGDGYEIEVPLADVQACTACVIQFDGEGYALAMSGMDTGTWVKDIRLIEVK